MMYFKMPINTGFMFFNPAGEKGHLYSFASNLDDIGSKFDVDLTNGSFITVISDPIDINHPKYGVISVSKIRADVATDYHTLIKEFWIPTSCIVEINNG